jgi:hypothetical protein
MAWIFSNESLKTAVDELYDMLDEIHEVIQYRYTWGGDLDDERMTKLKYMLVKHKKISDFVKRTTKEE